MRITALLIMALCVCACKEESREKEARLEVDIFGLDKIKPDDSPYRRVHLGGGLCIGRHPPLRQGEEWIIFIVDCYDSLPMDTLKHRQGGLCSLLDCSIDPELCSLLDCSIDPEKSFTVFMAMPIGFIESRGYSVFASRHSDSTMLYEYRDNRDIHRFFLKKYDAFWEELFSAAKPLKMDSASLKKSYYLKDRCNLEFCSTKDILKPLDEIICWFGLDSKRFECHNFGIKHKPECRDSECHDFGIKYKCRDFKCENIGAKLKPKCFKIIDYLLREYDTRYDILMHSGAFPVGDCDLGNWRYIKIKDLSKEHNRKLKELMKLDGQGL